MARVKYFVNESRGDSGSIRARSTEDLEAGTVVFISGVRSSNLYVSKADAQYSKKSTGLLFVAPNRVASGKSQQFVTFLIVPFTGDATDGDTIYLTKNGKWGLKKTKTAQPIGKILGGRPDELHALIAPQGQY